MMADDVGANVLSLTAKIVSAHIGRNEVTVEAAVSTRTHLSFVRLAWPAGLSIEPEYPNIVVALGGYQCSQAQGGRLRR